MSNTITIKNCKVVNEGHILEKDVIIKDGRFEKIDNEIESEGEVIDAAGLFLMPGIIDDQCHFREPGLTERGSIKTESLSAIAGGTTSFMDMPNVIPPTLNLDLWREKISIAEQSASANFSFYMGTSNTNIDEIKAIDPKEVCGIKIFMGSSTGNLHVDSEDALNDLFKDNNHLNTPKIYRIIKQMEPFGIGNPKPVFLFKKLLILSPVKVVGEKHLKFVFFDYSENKSIDGIWFNSSSAFKLFGGRQTVNIVGTVDENIFRGNKKMQITIKDINLI